MSCIGRVRSGDAQLGLGVRHPPFTSHGGRRRPRGHDRGLDDGCGAPARTATPPLSEPSRRPLTSLPCASGTSALPRAPEPEGVSGPPPLGPPPLDGRVIPSK